MCCWEVVPRLWHFALEAFQGKILLSNKTEKINWNIKMAETYCCNTYETIL